MPRRQLLHDSALFAFALLAGAMLFSNQVRQAELPGWAVALGTLGGLAACCALWVRRRWPVGVTLAILPVAALTSFASPAGLIAFYTVALHRRLTTVVWVGAAGMIPLSIAYALQETDRPELRTSLWLSLLSIVLLHVAVAAAGMYVHARRELLASLGERAERAEADQHGPPSGHGSGARADRARDARRARAPDLAAQPARRRIELRRAPPPEELARAAGVVRPTPTWRSRNCAR